MRVKLDALAYIGLHYPSGLNSAPDTEVVLYLLEVLL